MRWSFTALCRSILLVLGFWSSAVAAETDAVVDDFSDASRWEVLTSDGVSLKCSVEREDDADAAHATTLRLDYNFASSGFAGIRHSLPLDLPPNFELAFSVRGDLPRNNLEFKLVDETGENVWWVNRRAFEFPHDWTRLASRRRHFQFAWGPSSEPLRRASAIEIVVASAEGGHGTIWLDDLTFRPLPETKPYTGTPTLTASSAADDDSAARIRARRPDRHRMAIGRRRRGADAHDRLRPGSANLAAWWCDWDPAAFASELRSAVLRRRRDLDDRAKRRAQHRPDAIPVAAGCRGPRGAARRCTSHRVADHVAIRELEILPLEITRDANAFAQEIARRAPRGHYPRAIGGEGTFWTIVGVPADEHEALVSEDGAVEVDKQAFSIEPFLVGRRPAADLGRRQDHAVAWRTDSRPCRPSRASTTGCACR